MASAQTASSPAVRAEVAEYDAIVVDARLQSATYDTTANCWENETVHGQRARARYLVTAVGVLSVPYTPQCMVLVYFVVDPPSEKQSDTLRATPTFPEPLPCA